MKIPRFRNFVSCMAASLTASLFFTGAAAQPDQAEGSSIPSADDTAAVPANNPGQPAPALPVEVAESASTEAQATNDVAADGNVASPQSPSSDALVVVPPPAPPAKPAYNRDDVRWIQQRLQELGYYNGAIDGAFGRATREAIKSYQVDQELEQDGRPTAELRDFMWRNGG